MIQCESIKAWSAEYPWRYSEMVEQDLIICRAVVSIFSDPFLARELAWKGGTALHKLYLMPQVRYSEDIDLVQINPGPIKPIFMRLGEVLSWLPNKSTQQTHYSNKIRFKYLTAAVHRVAQIPGCEVTAICDISAEALDRNLTWLAEHGYRAPKEFGRGGDADVWKGLCDSDCCDVVYSATPRALHCAINVYGLDHGKHVLQEVPGAFTIEECWATVEAAERNRLHCMMLENCAYGEAEMLAYNLAMLGKFGEIVECEVGYTHDQRDLQYNPKDGKFWRMERHRTHHGNYYPTHGLVPAGRCLGINRGDLFVHRRAFRAERTRRTGDAGLSRLHARGLADGEAVARGAHGFEDVRHDCGRRGQGRAQGQGVVRPNKSH